MRIVFYSFLKHSWIQCKCYLCDCHLVVPAPMCWIPCSRLYVGLFPTHSIWMKLVLNLLTFVYTMYSLPWWRSGGKDSACNAGELGSIPRQATVHGVAKSQTWLSSVQFSSVAQLCPTLCDPMNHSTSGLPVHHQLPEFTQTHVHQVSDAIQPSHPLSFPSPPAPNPSQHHSLFQWINSSHEVAKVLEFQL